MPQNINEARLQGEIFLEPDEKLICVAGSPQLETYLEKGTRKTCFAVLSDRAIYCMGKCTVSRDRRNYQTQPTDFRIDLEEFQNLKHLRLRNKFLLSLTFFFLLLGPVLLLLDKLTHFGDGIALNPVLDAVICMLFAGVFYLLYMIHQKSFLELLHTNGSIGLNQHVLPDKDARLLIRYLRGFLHSRDNPQICNDPEELP